MELFISWSGARSRRTARLLHEWLPQVINEIDPWMSDVDISAGGDWGDEIRSRLNSAEFGIICVTPGNAKREWLLFEAGALSRQVGDSTARVAPFLIGFNEKAELRYPLARFQATEPTKADMLKLLLSMNSQCKKPRDPSQLKKSLDVFWPSFDEPFKAIRNSSSASVPHRSDRDLLQEILGIVRSLDRGHPNIGSASTVAGDPSSSGTARLVAARQALATITALNAAKRAGDAKEVEALTTRLFGLQSWLDALESRSDNNE